MGRLVRGELSDEGSSVDKIATKISAIFKVVIGGYVIDAGHEAGKSGGIGVSYGSKPVKAFNKGLVLA